MSAGSGLLWSKDLNLFGIDFDERPFNKIDAIGNGGEDRFETLPDCLWFAREIDD